MPAIKLTHKRIGENKQRRKNRQMQLETNMADLFIIIIGGIMIGILVCVIHMMPREESWATGHVPGAM